MRKMNKKGFTIVELVIVIAVIAILSAVLIPTFSGVVANSKVAAAKADAKAAYQQLIVDEMDKGNTVAETADFIYVYDTNALVAIKDGQVDTTKVYTFAELTTKYNIVMTHTDAVGEEGKEGYVAAVDTPLADTDVNEKGKLVAVYSIN